MESESEMTDIVRLTHKTQTCLLPAQLTHASIRHQQASESNPYSNILPATVKVNGMRIRPSNVYRFIRGGLPHSVEWFARQNAKGDRVMTDNSSAFLAKEFSTTCEKLSVQPQAHAPTRHARTEGRAIHPDAATRVGPIASRTTARRIANGRSRYLHFYNYQRAHSAIAYNPHISRLDRNNS